MQIFNSLPAISAIRSAKSAELACLLAFDLTTKLADILPKAVLLIRSALDLEFLAVVVFATIAKSWTVWDGRRLMAEAPADGSEATSPFG